MKNPIVSVVLVFLILLSSGCSPKVESGKVVATVNGEPIFLKDLKREVAIMAKRNPSLDVNKETLNDLLDTLAKKRLIIQEAMKKGMVKEEKFVNTIRVFWEQTLIRGFLEFKNRELETYVYITDKDVQNYYNSLKKERPSLQPIGEIYDEIKKMVKKEKIAQAFEEWLKDKKENAEVSVNKKLLYGEMGVK